MVAQLAILGACYLQTLNVLMGSGPKYCVMETPRHLIDGTTDKAMAESYVHSH